MCWGEKVPHSLKWQYRSNNLLECKTAKNDVIDRGVAEYYRERFQCIISVVTGKTAIFTEMTIIQVKWLILMKK